MTVVASSELDVRARRLDGLLMAPRDAGWHEATQAYNLTVTQEPAFAALPASEQDVMELVRFAAANGFRLAPQRTGHNAEPLGSLEDVILVKTDRLQGVEIDAERRVARVRAGSKWASVVPRASELGLAALHGSTPDVSVAGYSLGGGVGWYARKLGLSTNSVLAIELVTADGELRRVDADHDPELFWALRGGGGNFGIVTALEIRLYAIPEVYAGVLFFPWQRSSEVLHTWLEWSRTVPDEMTSVGRILQFPPLPELPDHLRGQQFVVAEVFFLGDEQDGAELLRPLRELGPALDTVAMVPPVGIAETHMDPPDPLPYLGEGLMLDGLDAAAIDRFVAAAGPDSGSTLVSAEIRHLGGALRRHEPHHGALSTLDGDYLTFQLGLVLAADDATTVRGELDVVATAFAPYDRGRRYLNFTESHTDPARFYPPDTYARLRQVKARLDPGELFLANHPIPPAD